ncbi:MAG: hypothetical protein H7Z75_09755 [Ferruginibacter sp.]|nr:hypothetical protein [Cytophagales bacterium]
MSVPVPTTGQPTVAPIAAGERLPLLDVLRGFALLGVLLANLIPWLSGNALLLARQPGGLSAGWPDRVVQLGLDFLVSRKFITLSGATADGVPLERWAKPDNASPAVARCFPDAGSTRLLASDPFYLPAITRTRSIPTTMTDWKILAVKNSWSYLLLHSEEAGALFYQRLFELDPALETLFKPDMTAQAKKLVDMLTLMVTKLQSMADIEEEVRALAQRHVHYGTRPEHYQTVGQALVHTLEMVLGDRWDEETRRAWAEVYAQWARAMIEAGSPTGSPGGSDPAMPAK